MVGAQGVEPVEGDETLEPVEVEQPLLSLTDTPPSYDNLGYSLNDLAERYEAAASDGAASTATSGGGNGTASTDTALEQRLAGETTLGEGNKVAVTVRLSGNSTRVATFLTQNGGDIRNAGADYIEAYVPVSALGQLSLQAGVTHVEEIVPPEPRLGPVTSQGVSAHLADAWHKKGITGKGVKVGVIDVGFYGLSNLLGKELPGTVIGRC